MESEAHTSFTIQAGNVFPNVHLKYHLDKYELNEW